MTGERRPPSTMHPASFEEHYRLYVDESGDHVPRDSNSPIHHYLCLLGCWMQGRACVALHRAMEEFKQRHVPHNHDEPVILHACDIRNRKGPFWRLRDAARRASFDDDLIGLVADADFTVVAIVIDKPALLAKDPILAHPYHLAFGLTLERYCAYLNHVNRVGDVMGESRGGRENQLLADSFQWVYERGAWKMPARVFQQALTSRNLKVEQKKANIAGLQLADLLAHAARDETLIERGRIPGPPSPFEKRLMATIATKFNRHLYKGRVEGYGKVLFPSDT